MIVDLRGGATKNGAFRRRFRQCPDLPDQSA